MKYAEGVIKENVGSVLGNDKMQAEGQGEPFDPAVLSWQLLLFTCQLCRLLPTVLAYLKEQCTN